MPKVPPALRPHSKPKSPGHSLGIKFSKKANMWCFYDRKNAEKTDLVEWFQSEQEASDRLLKAQLNG